MIYQPILISLYCDGDLFQYINGYLWQAVSDELFHILELFLATGMHQTLQIIHCLWKGESVDIFDKRPKACYYDQYPFPGGNKKCITAWKYLESVWSIPCRSWTGGLARRPWGAWKWVDPNGRAPLGRSHRGTETTMLIVCRWNTGGR